MMMFIDAFPETGMYGFSNMHYFVQKTQNYSLFHFLTLVFILLLFYIMLDNIRIFKLINSHYNISRNGFMNQIHYAHI